MEITNSILSLLEMLMRRTYSAEKQIFDHLAEAAEHAFSGKLKDLFAQHRKETAHQINRLERAFGILGQDPHKTTIGEAKGGLEKGKELVKGLIKMSFTGNSETIEGVISDGKEVFGFFANTEVNDLVLALEVEAIEEAEIAAYNTLCTLAEGTEYSEVLTLLQETLEEEKKAQKALNRMIAEEIKTVKV